MNTDHLQVQCIGYLKHLMKGLEVLAKIAITTIWTMVVVLVHTILPWWWEEYAKQLAERFE